MSVSEEEATVGGGKVAHFTKFFEEHFLIKNERLVAILGPNMAVMVEFFLVDAGFWMQNGTCKNSHFK